MIRRPIYPIDERRHASNFGLSFELLAQPLRHSDRRLVLGMDRADDVVQLHLIEGMVQ